MNKTGDEKSPDEMSYSLIRQLSSHAYSGKLRLMYRGLEFFDPLAEERINRGNLMHEIFSMISSYRDLEWAVEKIRREGMIGRGEAGDITREIRQILQVEPYQDWFDGSWKVIAERDILDRGGALRRPDRVMIKDGRMIVVDYKFGHVKSASHKQQVKQYVDILRQMKTRDVRGYIWYVVLNELVEI
jgi:hypothetical protein